jgi:hypothetical protein
MYHRLETEFKKIRACVITPVIFDEEEYQEEEDKEGGEDV